MYGKVKNYIELLPSSVILELYDYIHPPNYKLVDWVPIEKLDLQIFLYNRHPGAVDVLLKGEVDIDIAHIDRSRLLNENPRLVELLTKLGLDGKSGMAYKSQNSTKISENFDITTLLKSRGAPPSGNLGVQATPDTLVENCVYPDYKIIQILEAGGATSLSQESWRRLTKIPKTSYLLRFLEKNIEKLDVECMRNICHTPTDDVVTILINPSIGRLDSECWENICRNAESEKAIELILGNISQINIECLGSLCENGDTRILTMVGALVHMFDIECWNSLCRNKNQIVVGIISKNLGLFPLRSWEKLCDNGEIDSSPLLRQNTDKLDDRCWGMLSRNSRTEILLEIIAKNIDRLQYRLCWFNVWNGLCQNTNPVSIDILKMILPVLKDNILFWKKISSNQYIFTEDGGTTKIFRKKWHDDLLLQK